MRGTIVRTTAKTLVWVAIGLIIVTGLVHLIDAPDAFEEITYKGVLFVLNGVGALAAAYGIYRNQRWGWTLGLVISVGSILAYVMSRTAGLPGLPAEPDEWLEPLGVISLLAEAGFTAIALASFRPVAPNNTPMQSS